MLGAENSEPEEACLKSYLLLAFPLYSLLPRLVTYCIRKKSVLPGPWYRGIILWLSMIRGNPLDKLLLTSVVQDWVPSIAQDCAPPAYSSSSSHLWAPHQICRGVQSSSQDLLLVALNDSSETDPSWLLHSTWCKLAKYWLNLSQWGRFFSMWSPPIAGEQNTDVLPQRRICLKHHKITPTHEKRDFRGGQFNSGHNRYVIPNCASFCFKS